MSHLGVILNIFNQNVFISNLFAFLSLDLETLVSLTKMYSYVAKILENKQFENFFLMKCSFPRPSQVRH